MLGNETHERVWRMPILPEHEAMLKNQFADTSSTGGSRFAGACTAAAFLRKFVNDGVKWAHIDIAGPAMYSKARCDSV
jgi:leucyl aminopeptidase